MDENKCIEEGNGKTKGRRKVVTERDGGGVAVEEIGEGRERTDLIVRKVMGGAGEGREGSGK